MFKKRKKDVGFTLIELLSVIVVLAIITGLVVYVAINVIDSSKENTYKVTVKEIEKTADSYLIENSDRLFYVAKPETDNVEYQCIMVKTLIDSGFFDSDILLSKVSKNTNVKLDDYVYVERDSLTKNILKTKYLINEDVTLCDEVVKAIGDVVITVEPIDYSIYKEITLVYKIKNYYNIDDYSYEYSYEKNDYTYNVDGDKVFVEVISDDGNVKKLRVNDNGTINGYIKYKDGNDVTRSVREINNIDKTPPVIVSSNIVRVYKSSFDLCEGLIITDNSEKEVICRTYLGDKEITNSLTSLVLGENVVTHEAEDKFGNVSERVSRTITLISADKEFNYLEEDQKYSVLADGVYTIEAYGAQGANSGGYGGYVKAEVKLKAGDTLIFNTGGKNGYNGGGGYKNSKYYPGGGATTVKLNGSYIVIAAGGGAKGNDSSSGGVGGNGSGAGGKNVGSGAGINGTNGGGGSSSPNYSYEECATCGGGCLSWEQKCDTCSEKCNCTWVWGGSINESNWYLKEVCETCTTSCNCKSTCSSYAALYSCNCKTHVTKGASGTGGTSSVSGNALIVENKANSRQDNGYAKISYKLED